MMNPVQFGAVRKLVWKNQPAYPQDHSQYEQYGKELSAGRERFAQAVDAHLQQLNQNHANDPDYQAVALNSGVDMRVHRLVIDGPDIARFAADVFKERMRVMAAYTQHFQTTSSGSTPSPKVLEKGPMPRVFDRHNTTLSGYQLESEEKQAEQAVIVRYLKEAEAAGNRVDIEV